MILRADTLLVLMNLNPVTRNGLFAVEPVICNRWPPSVMMVELDPAPCNIMPFVLGTVTPPVQVQFPAGTVTVSLSAAVSTAVWMSVLEQEAAATVAAWAFGNDISR